MTARKSARPVLVTLAATVAAAAIGGIGVLAWRHRKARHYTSIEPRHMPGSAADIHVAVGDPLKRH
ncbi:hypothetical protein [uncultured Sphingomonas sp.]|uniref:hypothetical protein n=1 Tax=uncultured Sphingomonas sp. TaxID=158754 RepID=UPI0025D26D27|nr:hypothetical protein [uncultured Sphingomonas sp.]